MINRNDEMYLKLLCSLLPKGKIWNKNPNSTLTKFLFGLSGELSRIEARSFELFDEAIPSRINELLEEYENDFGLYEENIELEKTFEERISSIITKLWEYGGIYNNYFINIANELGYTITIEEFSPFWCGLKTCIDAVGRLKNLFWWKVHITIEENINYNIKRLLYEFFKFKPSHTSILFDFKGREFSRGFNCGFHSQPDFDNSWGGNGFGKIGNKELGYSGGFSSGFANAYDYDGENYIGGFHYGFTNGFNRYSGGAYNRGFTIGFTRPH